jgi:hypothetical protein
MKKSGVGRTPELPVPPIKASQTKYQLGEIFCAKQPLHYSD